MIHDANSIAASNFNVRNPTVVIVHGWLDNMDASFNNVVRDGKSVWSSTDSLRFSQLGYIIENLKIKNIMIMYLHFKVYIAKTWS